MFEKLRISPNNKKKEKKNNMECGNSKRMVHCEVCVMEVRVQQVNTKTGPEQ